jgi:hypothetical protein
MNTRLEIQNMALSRVKEAKVLFRNHLYDAAIYMAGYSIELAFKAAICKTLDIDDFFSPNKHPEAKSLKTHKLDDLLKFSGLFTKFEIEKSSNPHFYAQWSHLKTVWSEQLRYEPIGKTQRQDAKKLLFAIEDPKKGILPWIQKHW